MKRTLSAALCCMALAATAQDFRVTGKLNTNEFDGVTVSLVRLDPADRHKNTTVDSATISDGRFSFSLPVAKPYLASIVLPPRDRYHSYALPDAVCVVEPCRITIDYPAGNPYRYRIEGGTVNADYDATILAASGDSLPAAYHGFIARHIGDDIGATLFLQRPADFFPAELYARLRSEVDQRLLHVSDSVTAARLRSAAADDSIRRATRVGAACADFTSLTSDGRRVSLASLLVAGRVLLLDFWASWCGPCRQEIPELKRLYAKYHNAGLDIVSVSLDTKREAWLKALQAERMPWLQLSTLEGFKSESARSYAVRAIPFVVLIGGDGQLLLVNIRGDELEKTIARSIEGN